MTTTLKPTGLPGNEYGAFEGKPYARASSGQTTLTPLGLPGGGYGSFEGRLSLTTSIRIRIALEVVARLATLGWNVQLRDDKGNPADSKIRAVVFQAGEDKRIENSEQYDSTLTITVEITVRAEDAHPILDAGNVYVYLDRMVTLAEKKMHDPDDWSLVGSTRNWVDGHDVSDPSEENTVSALVRLTFKYRHHYQNPEQ